MFNRSGQVQTCIVNKDKRHAFVKMVTRKDAVAAKEAMENSQYRVRQRVDARQEINANNGNYCRHDGVLVLAPETAVTTRAASASFRSTS